MTSTANPHEARWRSLMAGAQCGDRADYNRLLTEATPFLRSAIEQRLGTAWQSERVLCDALLTMHRLLHTYDPRRPITPWLTAIADAEARRHRARRRASFRTAFSRAVRPLLWPSTGDAPTGLGHADTPR